MKKQTLAFLLSLCLCLSASVPSYATETDETSSLTPATETTMPAIPEQTEENVTLSTSKIEADDETALGRLNRPTPDPDFVEMGLEDYLTAVRSGAIKVSSYATPLEAQLAAMREGTHTRSGSWEGSGSVWRYLENGTYVTNDWRFINNYWYYFGSTGYAHLGWLCQGGVWYYLRTSTNDSNNPDNPGPVCSMVKNWFKIGSHWYYFNNSGEMYHGNWYVINNKTYYFHFISSTTSGAEGYMHHGVLILLPKVYYCGSPGNADSGMLYRAGWLRNTEDPAPGDQWYYFDKTTGEAKFGWFNDTQTVPQGRYYFNGLGVMQTGWLMLNNDLYYLSEDTGAMFTGTHLFGTHTEDNIPLINGIFNTNGMLTEWSYNNLYEYNLAHTEYIVLNNLRFEQFSFYSENHVGYLRGTASVNLSTLRTKLPTAAEEVLEVFSYENTNNLFDLVETNSSGDIEYAFVDLSDYGYSSNTHGYTFKQSADDGTWTMIPPPAYKGVAEYDDNYTGFYKGEIAKSQIYLDDDLPEIPDDISTEDIDERTLLIKVPLHETGHAIGLTHTFHTAFPANDQNINSLMEPTPTDINLIADLTVYDLNELLKRYPQPNAIYLEELEAE